MKLKDKKGKKEVMIKKKALKMKKERIEDDCIKEKMIQWRLKKKDIEEQRRNKRKQR